MRFVLALQHAVLNSDLPAPARHLLLSLAVKADWETGAIPTAHTPALSTLSTMTGLSKSTVAEWLDVLQTAGWVKRDRPTKGGNSSRTHYTLLIGVPSVAKPERASRRRAKAPGSPPSGQVRLADTASCPPSGTRAVRLADSSRPPGGHASIKNSPPESSISRDRPTRAAYRVSTGSLRSRSQDASEGSRIPDDFRPTEEMRSWACANTPNVGHVATEAFIDYWKAQPSPRGLKTDWTAAWRNWMRREQVTLELRPGFRGTAVQTVMEARPTLPRPAEEMCRDHRGHRAVTCGLCRAERIAADK
ncbi:helix-turn-helix domain-containing protein [Couchioplanes azureus]|uniref:helix-turn-helix domain-containing protein n=1 Tax=Couchioplanes caeruleus TaxID=56438 RepID=UPI00166FC3C1|nr:helix-turn-helix domain-containing protein [Couchioplanes caeruleus]GGQ83781.1 hypothetical protein GCM10010166_62460 [Couchioplanes caeruleus subsp. azureus]